MVATLQYAKQKKYKSTRDYYDRFLLLCARIPKHPNDTYFKENFIEGLWTKIKTVIIFMPRRTLPKVVKPTIVTKEEMF